MSHDQDSSSSSVLSLVSVRIVKGMLALHAFSVLWDVLECLVLQWSSEKYAKSDLVN